MSKNLFAITVIAIGLLMSRGQSAGTIPKTDRSGEGDRTEQSGKASAVVQHFWFDYNAEPNPGRRVWIRVDESTWVELYLNGSEFRYKVGDRTTMRGIRGIAVRKVAGDPNQTWTLNDGSFEVFIPEKDEYDSASS